VFFYIPNFVAIQNIFYLEILQALSLLLLYIIVYYSSRGLDIFYNPSIIFVILLTSLDNHIQSIILIESIVNMSPDTKISKIVNKYLSQQGLTTTAMAELVGVTKQAVSSWANNSYSPSDATMLRLLASTDWRRDFATEVLEIRYGVGFVHSPTPSNYTSPKNGNGRKPKNDKPQVNAS
jgi:DNA-binding XRE family transcriptional regulator